MRRSFLLVFLLTLVLGASSASGLTQVGAFADYGSTCSFSGNGAGLLTVHVVVRTDANGVRAVRFTAPPPPCLGAVWVQDVVPSGIVSIGDSQTGISLSAGFCEGLALHVLDVVYQTNGTTTACCPFEIQPDPTLGHIEAIDCVFDTIQITSVTSHFNADATCPCQLPFPPPNAPRTPVPQDGVNDQDLNVFLSWICDDPNGIAVTCDLYLGTSIDPPLMASGIDGGPSFSFMTPALEENAQYYWRVVGRNAGDGNISGPVWRFMTGPNGIPSISLVEPANGAVEVSLTPTLKWVGSDDGPLKYDLYFGTNPNPPLVLSGTTSQQYTPSALPYETTYWWRVIAHDSGGLDGSSALWSFTTRPQNLPPNVPTSPSPANAAVNVSLSTGLSWQCTDPEGQSLTFDVYFGTATDPPLVASNRTSKSYSPGALQVETTYYWRILARDSGGRTRSGPVWNFRTRNNTPPAAPSNPTPSNGATGVSAAASLFWSGSDPDNQTIWFDVYWGTTSPPPLVASNVSLKVYNPGTQQFLTKYFWRIVARDTKGAETSGPTWSYTTKSTNDPPNAPTVLQPGNGATGQPVNSKLTWNATDPENDTLNFDVYFGTAASPPLVADHITNKNYDPGTLATSTAYRWKVVARDALGQETSSAVWSFTTASTSNLPPTMPSNPVPGDGTETQFTRPLLRWSATDPDGDPLHYTVLMFIHDTFPDYYAETDVPYHQMTVDLSPGYGVYWFVMVSDGRWTVTGPTWTFGVSGGGLPVAFQSFEVNQSGAAVSVHWRLSSDEAMQSYTLYRRDSAASDRVVIAAGRVERTDGSYLDTSVVPGRTYLFELVVQTTEGDEFRSPVATVSMAALELTLHQNRPNPFNPQTTIAYDLPSTARVRLMVVDVSGRLVRTLVDETQTAGSRSVIWNGRDDSGNAVSSGVYFYVLDAGKDRLTKKLVLLK